MPDATEVAIGSDPLSPDSDGDGFADGFEYYLLGASAPTVLNLGTNLSAFALLPAGDPVDSVEVQLWNTLLDQLTEPALTNVKLTFKATTDALGLFELAPWPTEASVGSQIDASVTHEGTLYTALAELPLLAPGAFVVANLEMEPQPYMRGKDFFISIPYTSSPAGAIIVMSFMNAGDEIAEVHWAIPGAPVSVPFATGTLQVAPGEAEATGLPAEYLMDRVHWPYDMEYLNLGVDVSASNPISVSVQVIGDGGAGMAAYSCLPTSSHGTEYYLKTLPSGWISTPSFMGAWSQISCDGPDSQLTLNFPFQVVLGENGLGTEHPPGVDFTAPLTKGSSLQTVLSDGTFSGAKCESTTPVGVLGGSTSLTKDLFGPGGYFSGGSTIIETVAPTIQWMDSYVTFGDIGEIGSRIYLQSGDKTTAVSIGGGTQIQLAPGQEYSFLLTQNGATTITSDFPILAWQTFSWAGRGDAGVHLAPPNRWSVDEVLWAYSAPGMTNFMAILVPTSSLDELRIDGNRVITMPELTAPPSVVNGEFSLAIVQITGGSHRVTCPEPAFPMVFGRADALAGKFYAYSYSTVW